MEYLTPGCDFRGLEFSFGQAPSQSALPSGSQMLLHLTEFQ